MGNKVGRPLGSGKKSVKKMGIWWSKEGFEEVMAAVDSEKTSLSDFLTRAAIEKAEKINKIRNGINGFAKLCEK